MKNTSLVRKCARAALGLSLSLSLSSSLAPGLAGAASKPTLASVTARLRILGQHLYKYRAPLMNDVVKYAQGKLIAAEKNAISDTLNGIGTDLVKLQYTLEAEQTELLDFELNCSDFMGTDDLAYVACEAEFRAAAAEVQLELVTVQNEIGVLQAIINSWEAYEAAQSVNGDVQDFYKARTVILTAEKHFAPLLAKVERVIHWHPGVTTSTTTTVAG